MNLMQDIFLKQVRRLTYYQVYQNENWQFKRISNLIYELTERDFKHGKFTTESASQTVVQQASVSEGNGDDDPFVEIKKDTAQENVPISGKQQASKDSFMKYIDDELKHPGPKIFEHAELAYSMDTTLWFTEEHCKKDSQGNTMLDTLIACGQYTTCYNLLIYLSELHISETSPWKNKIIGSPEFGELYDLMMSDWIKFKEDPFVLLTKPVHQ